MQLVRVEWRWKAGKCKKQDGFAFFRMDLEVFKLSVRWIVDADCGFVALKRQTKGGLTMKSLTEVHVSISNQTKHGIVSFASLLSLAFLLRRRTDSFCQRNFMRNFMRNFVLMGFPKLSANYAKLSAETPTKYAIFWRVFSRNLSVILRSSLLN